MSFFTCTLRLLVTTIANREQPVLFINININCSMPNMWCPWQYWLASQWLPCYVQELKKTSSFRKNLKDIKEYSYFWWKWSIEYSTSLGPLSRETGKVVLPDRAPCPSMSDALRSVHPPRGPSVQGVTSKDPPLRCVYVHLLVGFLISM